MFQHECRAERSEPVLCFLDCTSSFKETVNDFPCAIGGNVFADLSQIYHSLNYRGWKTVITQPQSLKAITVLDSEARL